MWQVVHTDSTVTHQSPRCSAPCSPIPHSGHLMWRTASRRSGPGPLVARSSCRRALRQGGTCSSGSRAHLCPLLHSPMHCGHHPCAGVTEPSLFWKDDVQQYMAGCPHAQRRVVRASVGRHRAPPGIPLLRKRSSCQAAVSDLQWRRRAHSCPPVGARRRRWSTGGRLRCKTPRARTTLPTGHRPGACCLVKNAGVKRAVTHGG